MKKPTRLRAQILELVSEYSAEAFPAKEFVAGESHVPVSGRVFDGADIQSLVDLSSGFLADHWPICRTI